MRSRILLTFLYPALACLPAQVAPLRAPAVPLVTHDPYFSVWSFGDQLTGSFTRHWTGAPQPLNGLIRIDGQAYRYAGIDSEQVPPMEQTSLKLTLTSTRYEFTQAGVRLGLTFLTPALPDDLDLLSRPITFIHFDVSSVDGREHEVQLELDVSSQLAVNKWEQRVNIGRYEFGNVTALRAWAAEQKVLGRSGDDLRIEWGSLYLGIPHGQAGTDSRLLGRSGRSSFARDGKLAGGDMTDQGEASHAEMPLLAATFDLGKVGAAQQERLLLLAYDDVWSIEYLNRRLRPLWRQRGRDIAGLLEEGAKNYSWFAKRARAFDEELTSDLVKSGGPEYAALATVAYRQAIAAHKLVADVDGTPLLFPKENFSNGCISTVDVIYPSAPLFLLLNPELLKGMLRPVLDYAALPRWRWPFAPHDLGQYPLANGQVYGGGERTEEDQMPVEESGNMLILLGALAHVEGNADFALRYWPQLVRWAEYLRDKGMDPENQLSTDDFAGHLAHNTNLSIKAILGLRAFAEIARMGGKSDVAAKYEAIAKQMAAQWPAMALDGDHYKLAFDKPGTWSQKYNLVWDRLLGYNLFPPEVARQEVAFYETKLQKYGLPLDNRKTYTKLDWEVWTSCLTGKDEDFRRLIAPLYRWMNETPTRVPLTDWYETTDGKQAGFQARSVVGGLFIPLLRDPEVWNKWASRGLARAKQEAGR
ncbi:MAG: glutaminase domain-containing protein [Bryobacteraceae bacterium]